MNLQRMAKKTGRLEVGTVEAAISNDEDVEHQGGADEALCMLKKILTALTTEDQREPTSYCDPNRCRADALRNVDARYFLCIVDVNPP